MKSTQLSLRRLILGMSVEDAQSKFDTAESRLRVRLAHEHHNQHVLHELHRAQKARNVLPAERKCHISRFAKPSVAGFQAVVKESPDDYYVEELWEAESAATTATTTAAAEAGGAPAQSEGLAANQMTLDEMEDEEGATTLGLHRHTAVAPPTAIHSDDAAATGSRTELVPYAKVQEEVASFLQQRRLVVRALQESLDIVADNVLRELSERRSSGSLVTGQQKSLIDQLVDKNKEATQKNYKRVSSSSHLLDSVEMTLNLYNRKDKAIAEAFRSPELFIPAREASVSFSLWVAGGLIARERLCDEFPFHIAKYVIDSELQQQQQQQQQGHAATSAHLIPRLIVEVYFSPELYLLSSLVGTEGVVALRQYIGAVMRQQHEPVPTSASLLLNTLQTEQEQLFHPHSYLVTGSGGEGDRSIPVPTHIQIPWRDARLSSTNTNGSASAAPLRAKITGTVLDGHQQSMTSSENSNSASIGIDKMKEGIQYVWKTWGHLVKDLHVYADLDFLYVSIDRAKEMKENNDYMNEVKSLDDKLRAGGELPSPQATSSHYDEKGGGGSGLLSSPAPHHLSTSSYLSPISSSSSAHPTSVGSHKVVYVPLSADFTVIECTLERKGLHHNMVLEDITQTLTEMQNQSLEAARLAFIDEMENYVASLEEEAEAAEAAAQARGKKKGKHKAAAAARRHAPPRLTLSSIVPVIYAPKVVVTHAGTIDNGTHSFQKIRIRGSSVAHVEGLCRALQQEQYFTSSWDGAGAGLGLPSQLGGAAAPILALPSNLSFVNSHHSMEYLATAEGGSARAAEASSSFSRAATAAAADCSSGKLSVRDRLLRGQRAFSPSHHSNTSTNNNHNNNSAKKHKKGAGAPFEEYVVTAEEREFWRENYYKLTEPKLLLHDRVDAADALVAQQHHPNSKALRDTVSARLREHLRVVNSRLQTEEETKQQQQQQGDEKSGGGGRTPAATRRATLDLQRIAPEKMYEYLCTDCEAETAMWDLRIGDHKGYFYKLNLTHIPSKDMKKNVPQALQSAQRKGFINYFGPERFGSYTKLNMHPGLHLLKGDFRAAAHIIVQQFYLDAALRAQQQLQSNFTPTAAMLPRLVDFAVLGGAGQHQHNLYYQPFGNAHHSGKRNVAEDGTALQRVLNNALQASLLMGEVRPTLTAGGAGAGGGGGVNSATAELDDPCADAFLNVIGPNACRVLIHEFLSFVWNDIVNQRLQRYGTYCVLPGDLVRRKSLRSSPSFNYSAALADSSSQTIDITEIFQDPHELTFVRQRDIEERLYTPFDVLLPLPGAAMLLPQNHTADLYVITLRRYGLVFNPEDRQWDCFYPRQADTGNRTTAAGSRRGRAAAASPYHNLTSSFSIMEEDLANTTSYDESYTTAPKVFSRESYVSSASAAGGKAAVDGRKRAHPELLVDATAWRADLRREGGNACDLWIHANYRAPLMNPSAQDVSLTSVLPVRSSLYSAAIAAASATATADTATNEAGVPVFSFVESSDGSSSSPNNAAFVANESYKTPHNTNFYKEAQTKINALASPFQRWGASRRLSQESFAAASVAAQLRQSKHARADVDDDDEDDDETIAAASSTSSVIDTEGMLEIEEINKNAHRLHKPRKHHHPHTLNSHDTIDTEGPDYDYADVESNPFALPNGEELITGPSSNNNDNNNKNSGSSSSNRRNAAAAAGRSAGSSLLVYESPRQQKGHPYKSLPLPRPAAAATAQAPSHALSTAVLRDVTRRSGSHHASHNNNITNIIPYWRYESLCEPHSVQLQFQLPNGSYSSMLLRELTKMDVNYADRDVLLSSRQREAQQQQQQRQQQQHYVAKRRAQRLLFDRRPRALSAGLLHQSVFRSEGIRQSLLPTLRSYDSVSK